MPEKRIDLEDVFIGAPCCYGWENMTGDSKTKVCGGCDKSVFNLAEFSAPEAQALIDLHQDAACLHITRDFDGKILTKENKLKFQIEKQFRRALFSILSIAISMSQALAKSGDPKVKSTNGKASGLYDSNIFQTKSYVVDGHPCFTAPSKKHSEKTQPKPEKPAKKELDFNPSWLKTGNNENSQKDYVNKRVFLLYKAAKEAAVQGKCTESLYRFKDALELAKQTKQDPAFVKLIEAAYQKQQKIHETQSGQRRLRRQASPVKKASPTLPEGAPIPDFK